MREDDSEANGERRWSRRPVLQAIGSASAFGLTTPLTSTTVRADHETDPCAVTLNFNRAKVARVSDVQAAGITSLTVFYFDRDDNAQKQENIDPTANADYGDLSVRYSAGADQTTIQIGGPNTAIRRIIAFGPDCRSAETNPLESAAGENTPPTADFTWSPDPAIAGEPVTFTSTATDSDGELIHYGWDFDADGTENATGQQVTHTFDTASEYDVTHTVVDDFDAANSLTKTVTIEEADRWEQIAKLAASDGDSFDRFGNSVAIDGDTALITAFTDENPNGPNAGSAYVFTQTGGTWSQQAKLAASDGAADDIFGAAALDGDTALIGAIRNDANGSDSGAAYVFTRTNGTWTEQQKLTPSDGAAGDHFGTVALDGDTAVIGATLDDDNGTDSGSAYVFTRTNDTWTEQQKLTASDGSADDRFGVAALDGDTVLISSFFDDDNGSNSGSVYVFTRTNGTWTEQQKLTASDGSADDWFGSRVAIDGDTAVIGALLDDDNGTNSGSAYVFTRTNGTWTEEQKLTASDGAADDLFVSEAIDGDTILCGAQGDDDKGSLSGSAYVYTREDGTWIEQEKLLAADGGTEDRFGASVALDGDTALIGAYTDGNPHGFWGGSAYVFRR